MSSDINTSLKIACHNVHQVFDGLENVEVSTSYNYTKDGHGHEQGLEIGLTIDATLEDNKVVEAEEIAQKIAEILS